MNITILKKLLFQSESPSLEFKREMYRIFDQDGTIKNRHRGELIRDILALANGNTTTAGETAYLIIGADDLLDSETGRYVHGVAGNVPSANDILSIVRPASDPPLDSLLCETFHVDGKQILVIIILPSPHLHETTRQIKTPNTSYSEHVVFIRRGASVEIASAKERAAIQDLKAFRFRESKKVAPVFFGAVSGIMTGGSIATAVATKWIGDTSQQRMVIMAGYVVGGLVGLITGQSYKNALSIRRELQEIPKQWRFPVMIVVIGASAGGAVLIQKAFQWLRHQTLFQTPDA